MTWTSWVEAHVARLNAFDIGLLKICVIAFTLMVAKLWPPLLFPDWKVFACVFLLTYVPLAAKLLMKSDGHA